MSQADDLTPPIQGQIYAVAITLNTVTAAYDLALSSQNPAADGAMVTVGCDDGAGNAVPFYYTLGPNSSMAAPDPTSVSGNTRTAMARNGFADFILSKGENFIRIYPKGTGYMRAWQSSPKR